MRSDSDTFAYSQNVFIVQDGLGIAANLCNAMRTSATTVAQSPMRGRRKRRIAPGYQGESIRPVSQRQSIF